MLKDDPSVASGNLTARPQPGKGHHLIFGLLSTNACKVILILLGCTFSVSTALI